MLALTTLLPLLLAATRVSAFNCETHTFTQCADNIVHWYDPDDGMICDPLDCGGGRAPPKTDVPCCANYKGTEVCDDTPKYLPCFGDFATATSMDAPEATGSTPAVEATLTSMDAPEATGSTPPVGPASSEEVVSESTIQNVAAPTSAGYAVSSSTSETMTQPPVSSATMTGYPTGHVGNGTAPSGGNATLSGGVPSPSAPAEGNSASGVRYDALVAIAGALVALV